MKSFLSLCAFVFSFSAHASAPEVGVNELMFAPTTDATSLQARLFQLADFGYRTGAAPVEYLTYRGGSLRRLAAEQSAVICSQISQTAPGQFAFHCKFEGVRQLATRSGSATSVQGSLTTLLRQANAPFVHVRQNGNATVYRLEGSNAVLECQYIVGGYTGCAVSSL